MKSRNVIIALIVLVVIAIVTAVFVGNKSNTYSKSSTNDMSNMHMNTPNSPSSTKPVTATSVTISNFSFSPAVINVKAGQSVTWTNQDTASHTVTADTASAAAPNSQTLAKGANYSFTFTQPGTYAYHCAIHPSMKGTVVVTQ